MRQAWTARTGSFGPEDPWFEPRVRAFWDDALTTQGFAALAVQSSGQNPSRPPLPDAAQALAAAAPTVHRGFFVVDEVDERGACLVDAWSGAELLVRHLDDTQALTLEHAEGGIDARITSGLDSNLYLLPGAYHHPADALDPALDVLVAAQERGMKTQDALDALLRMELVLRSSSRVKAGFAYRVEGLDPPQERPQRASGHGRSSGNLPR